MREQYLNNSATTLNGAINNSVTSITVTSGAVFPSTGDFRLKVDDELMLCTARSSNTLTVTRGIEGSNADSHIDLSPVKLVLTAASLENIIRQRAWKPYPPFTPAGIDDEFDDGSFSGWTAVNSGTPTLTITETNDVCSIYHPGGGASANLLAFMKTTTINANDYIEICFRSQGVPDNFPIIGLLFADGTTFGSGQQAFLNFSATENAWIYGSFSGFNSNNGQTSFNTLPACRASHTFLRFTYLGSNNFKAQISPDGISWINLTTSFSRTLTPTACGFFVTTWGASTQHIFSLEYFRKGT